MLRIDRSAKTFEPLDEIPLREAGVSERTDLQQYILNSPAAFFGELREDLYVLGQEITPSDTVRDRIDVLAVDKAGNLVVIELKRGKDKLQLLQAVAYAGMVSMWTPERILDRIKEDDPEGEALSEFLDVELDSINREQRVMLVAEGFDIALLRASEWLVERYDVPIECIAISLAKDGEVEYLAVSRTYPPQGVDEHAIARTRRRAGPKLDPSSPRQLQYSPLAEFLKAQDADSVSLTFQKVEELVGQLPGSARRLRAWWANTTSHSQGLAWMNAGWRKSELDLSEETVTFIRTDDD